MIPFTPAQNASFQRIGLLGIPRSDEAKTTFLALYNQLIQSGYQVFIDNRSPELHEFQQAQTASIEEIGEYAELAIVVGGDGNMLGAARVLSLYDIGVIGINRGNLGFLTDLAPEEAIEQLSAVLAGQYSIEYRFLLQAEVALPARTLDQGNAMNEIVLHSDKVAHMIEFELFIDDAFVFSQRSDGLIIATPTGSTAYSLSAGGSILHPALSAINIIPMFPHTLSSRPLVISADSRIELRIAPTSEPLHISCDGHNAISIPEQACVRISRQAKRLRLIHPLNYHYYRVLRNKLNWGSRLF